MRSILFIILDGLGDRPIKEFGGLTPLEAALTPNLDMLASKSICGNMYSLGVGIRPSSDVAHMTLFGVDYKRLYPGRGPLELIGAGQDMEENDIAFRGNFCTLDKNGIIIDRRAKRKKPSERLCSRLKRININGFQFDMFNYAEHRFALRVRGKSVSTMVSDSDPHRENVHPLRVVPTKDEENAKLTAQAINEYLSIVSEICLDEAEDGISGVLLRSVGKRPQWDTFNSMYGITHSCCLANNALYSGIAKSLGMRIISSKHYDNYLDYYSIIPETITKELQENEFVFLHIAEGDLFGEDGNSKGKKAAIEHIDSTLSFLNQVDLESTLIVVTADHSTPCALKAHSGDSVPIIIAGEGIRVDEVKEFGERSCSKGLLGTVCGSDLMNLVMNFCGKATLIGG